MWWAAALSRHDAELACDEAALRGLDLEGRRAYGQTLISLVSRTPGQGGERLCAATTMSGNIKQLKGRITMIAKRPRMTLLTLILVLAVTLLAAACSFAGSGSQGDLRSIPKPAAATYVQTLYDSRVQYLGDASAVGALINATGLMERLGGYSMELETAAEPYGLRLFLEVRGDSAADLEQPSALDRMMEDYALVLLSLVDNLSWVEWEYEAGRYVIHPGQEPTFTRSGSLTLEEGGQLIGGGNVKDYAASAEQLQELVDQTQLIYRADYQRHGISLALPEDYAQLVSITPPEELDAMEERESGSEEIILEAYHKTSQAAYEGPGEGFGFIFRIIRSTPAQFEDLWQRSQISGGVHTFAFDGEYYYSRISPTDVRAASEYYDEYDGLGWEASYYMLPSILALNPNMEPYGGYAFDQEYTFDSDHLAVDFQLSDGARCTLILSQPVDQGQGGIWCADRWSEDNGNLYVVVPDTDLTTAEYYQQLQADCDNGVDTWRLDPEQVTRAFITEELGQADQDIQLREHPSATPDWGRYPPARN